MRKTFYLALEQGFYPSSLEEGVLCDSHFWGDPDLPSGMKYPVVGMRGMDFPYHFVCQINLADFPDTGILPRSGLLQFYANIYYYLGWDADPEIGGTVCSSNQVKVLYFPEKELGCFERNIVIDKGKRIFPDPLAIHYVERLPYDDPQHHLLGEPEFREWDDWESPFEGWRVLLQVDSFEGSDFNLNFMDCGVLDFIIPEEDLRNGDFSRVRAIVLSS